MITDDDLALIDPNWLSPLARRLVKCIGMAATIKLLEFRGGCQLVVPKKPSNLLRGILTDEQQVALCAEFDCERLELPKLDRALKQIRNHTIKKLRHTMSDRQLAQRFNVSRRWIYKICPKNVEPNPQTSIFDEV